MNLLTICIKNFVSCTADIMLSFLFLFVLLSTEILSTEVFVCENNSESISCFSSQTIHVDFAFFGRDNRVTCPRPPYDEDTQCAANNATEVLRQTCEGQQNCTLAASYKVFGDPCYGVYKFLQVNYTCVNRVVCGENEEYGCDNLCVRHCQHSRFCSATTCEEQCMCKEGYKRDSATGRCIDEKYCPLPTNNGDCHEVFSGCDAGCQANCTHPRPCCSGATCVAGYVCVENYVRDTITGQCVTPAQCTSIA